MNLTFIKDIIYNLFVFITIARLYEYNISKEKEKLDYIYDGDKIMEKIREGFESVTSTIDSLL